MGEIHERRCSTTDGQAAAQTISNHFSKKESRGEQGRGGIVCVASPDHWRISLVASPWLFFTVSFQSLLSQYGLRTACGISSLLSLNTVNIVSKTVVVCTVVCVKCTQCGISVVMSSPQTPVVLSLPMASWVRPRAKPYKGKAWGDNSTIARHGYQVKIKPELRAQEVYLSHFVNWGKT